MSKFAVTAAGVCVNIAIADDDAAAQLGWAPLPEGHGIGDSYDSETDEWTKAEE